MKTSAKTSRLAAVIAALFNQSQTQEFNFADYAARHQLAPESIHYVTQSRARTALEPNGYQSNTVRYPSLLTRCNLTGHSRGWEYPLDVMLSHDPECEFIIDSPQELQLEYLSANGELVTPNYPPDRLVFWRNRPPEIIEVRSFTRLGKLCLERPGRYKEEKPGYFRSPPAEAAAAKLGFSYRIIHEKNFTPVYLQNLTFLESYLLHDPTPMPSEVEVTAILEQVESTPGITLEQIAFEDLSRRADLVYWLIAKGALFTHLSDELLKNQNHVALFLDPTRERAFLTFDKAGVSNPVAADALPYELAVGTELQIKSVRYRVTKIEDSQVHLVGEDGAVRRLTYTALQALMPSLDNSRELKKSIHERLRSLGDEALTETLARHHALLPFLPGGERCGEPIGHRSKRRWLARYRQAEAKFGQGMFGLIPRTSERGNRKPHIPLNVSAVTDRLVERHYLHAQPKLTARKVFFRIRRALRLLKIDYPITERTVARRCKAIDRHRADSKRLGKKIAADSQIPSTALSAMGSPNGTRSWEVAHCDHTQRDVALDHPEKSKRLEKHWHTVMVDAFDHRVLSWVSSPDSPRTDTIIQLLRKCVAEHGTLPKTIVTDWGADFRSTWLQKTLTMLGITVIYRPRSSGRAGSPVELKFAQEDKQYIHSLTGSTELLKRARQVTPAVDPRRHALWGFDDIEALDQEYYNTYNNTPHPPLLISPNAKAKEMDYLGRHARRLFSLDMLRRALLPLVDGVTRKVSKKGTVYVGRCIYGSTELGDLRGVSVDVRYDPEDRRMVYVFHPKRRCLIECRAVDSRLKYTANKYEAEVLHHAINSPDPAALAEASERWGDFDARIEDTEAQLKERRKQRARQKPRVEPAPTENVVHFEYSAGGFTTISNQKEKL